MNKKEIEFCLNSKIERGLDDKHSIALAIYYLAKVIEEQNNKLFEPELLTESEEG